MLLSALGLVIAPGPEPAVMLWLRYGKQVVQLAVMVGVPGLAGLRRCAGRRAGAGPRACWWPARCCRRLRGCCSGSTGTGRGRCCRLLERFFTSNPAILSGSEQLHLGDGFRDVPRLRGTACEPLYLGNYLLLVLPAVALTGWRRGPRGGVAAVLGLLLVLTWSRGAWLAGRGRSRHGGRPGADRPRPAGPTLRRPSWRGLGGGRRRRARAGAAAGAGPPGPARRSACAESFSRRDWSNLTRLYSMQAAWRAFLLSPVVGVGWGQFGWHFPVLVDAAGLQSQFQWPVVNNFPLQILCETGLVGFGVFAAAAAALVRARCARCR